MVWGRRGGEGTSWGWPASQQSAASRRGEENDNSLEFHLVINKPGF